jgi:hypothetical protein
MKITQDASSNRRLHLSARTISATLNNSIPSCSPHLIRDVSHLAAVLSIWYTWPGAEWCHTSNYTCAREARSSSHGFEPWRHLSLLQNYGKQARAPASELQLTCVKQNAPTATGHNIDIYPTNAQDIPGDGAYFVFGPDITKDMLNSVGGDCAKLDDPKCQASLDKIFGNDDNNLVGRSLKQWFRLGKAIGSVRNVFVGAIAFLTIKWKANGGHLDDGQGLKLHFPSSALSVIQGASAATRVAYKTADNDPSAVTANIPASATASHGSEGLFTILNADANGHHKGNIKLTASSDNDANALNDYYKKEGICPAGPKKRGIQVEKRVPNVAFDVDCIVNDVQNILDGMEGNGPLGGYREQMMQLAPMADPPNWASEVIDGAWRQALVYAGGRMPNALGIRNEQVPAATRAVFFLAIAQNHAIKMVARSLYIEAQGLLIEKGIYLKCPDKNNKWFPKCDNFVCQGKDGKCTTNFLKPCECNGGDQSKCPAEVDKRVCSFPVSLP